MDKLTRQERLIKRNQEIRELFRDIYIRGKLRLQPALDEIAAKYHLSPDTVYRIVIKSGNYRDK